MCKISFILPTKNRPNDLCKAISSILPQLGETYELIIIDQSDVNQKLLINNLLTVNNKTVLKYFHRKNIKSLIEAKDFGVSQSSGEIIGFLEDDIEVCENYVRNILFAFKSFPNLIGGCGTEIRKRSRLYTLVFNLTHLGIFKDPRVSVDCVNTKIALPKPIESNFLSGGISFYKKEVFAKVKFDLGSNFFALEDIDFSTRVKREFLNNLMAIFPNVCILHHRSPMNRARAYEKWEMKVREFITFYKKNKDSKLGFFNLSWLIFFLLILSLFESIKLLSIQPIFGFNRGLKNGFLYKLRS